MINRVRDWLDAPRFCHDDGQPISVRSIPAFDERTGEQHDRWYWSCPDVRVSVSVGGGSVTWSQSGDHIHAHGQGRPRWHRAETAEASS